MSCTCTTQPCTCGVSVMPIEPCPAICVPDQIPALQTLCDLSRLDNVWVDGPVSPEGQGGICMLDNMEECQVIHSLQRSQRAKDDMLKVTSNLYLRNLAQTVPLLPGISPGDTLQKEANQNSIPFYALFRGQPPFAQ